MKKHILLVALLILVCLCLCSCTSKSANVDKLILAIGEVTLESEELIVSAETAYAELSEEDKAKVENYETLTAARTEYNDQKAAAEEEAERARLAAAKKQEATTLACKIITKMAKIYKNPLSIKVNNVWYKYSEIADIISWDFTFELSITNDYGNTVTEYYGMSLMETDELKDVSQLEQTLSDEVGFYTFLGYGVRWKKDSIIAMQYGSQLDAATVQAYFLKNYR